MLILSIFLLSQNPKIGLSRGDISQLNKLLPNFKTIQKLSHLILSLKESLQRYTNSSSSSSSSFADDHSSEQSFNVRSHFNYHNSNLPYIIIDIAHFYIFHLCSFIYFWSHYHKEMCLDSQENEYEHLTFTNQSLPPYGLYFIIILCIYSNVIDDDDILVTSYSSSSSEGITKAKISH